MKRGTVFLLFILTISIILSSCGPSLSEEELQKRADDYALLVETLQAVGYNSDFKLLKEKNSMEQNLRVLWKEHFPQSDNRTEDARKNIELLISLGNFDFIAEGLQDDASPENPYYNDWPHDSRYRTASRAVSFSDNEVLWLMLLLPDSDFPTEHLGLKEVLAECGENVLGSDFRKIEAGIWFYYEKTIPGLLEKVNPDFTIYLSDEMETFFKNADTEIQNRFMQAIDAKSFRNISYGDSPARVFSSDEAEELMREFPSAGLWEGGYIRIVDVPDQRGGTRGNYGIESVIDGYNIHKGTYGAYTYARESDVLVPVINPADARLAVYEEYTDGEYYATYAFGNNREFEVYLLELRIRIVDLLTGEEIFSEVVLANPPPEEISWTFFSEANSLIMEEGMYFHYDFNWSRYAAVMEEYCEAMSIR